jgi:hypothetical protein
MPSGFAYGLCDGLTGRLPRERRRMPSHGDRGRHGHRKGIVVGTSPMLASPRTRKRRFGNGRFDASYYVVAHDLDGARVEIPYAMIAGVTVDLH